MIITFSLRIKIESHIKSDSSDVLFIEYECINLYHIGRAMNFSIGVFSGDSYQIFEYT